ncbi:MAG: type II secretion system protein [Clostridia bacterium]|nr:type II secretion system protein [Clostridia bacterium]
MKIFAPFWNKRKGFTIVELVIVIAVIAILAAVLIPTFSSLIKKANLSADKQAVREMNVALAADEELHGKADTIEKAMRVLANAGYNSDNWVCLTTGYEVYWFAKENRLVLYNSATAEVEYPTDFDIKKLITADNGGDFYIYNNNQMTAIKQDVSLGSNASVTSTAQLVNNDAVKSSTTATSAINAVSSALSSNAAIKQALNLSNAGYTYGTKEVVSEAFGTGGNTAKAAMQIVAVGDTKDPVLKNNGDVQENVFFIQVATSGNPSAGDISSAQKAAGDMVYTLFTQMNTSQLDNNAAIILAPGTTIDVSGKEWAAVKEFEGYFGTTDSANPIVINGAEMSTATGYSQTVSFTGSSSKYFVTGFFGTVYGDTTIENVKFTNIVLNQPAMDFAMATFMVNGKKADNRNSIGIIGGVTENTDHTEANVVLKNIEVDSSCEVICGADGGGLVGYVGSADPSYNMLGKLTIDNCKVAAKVSNNYKYVSSGYGPVGGIVGFICRVNAAFELKIKDCTFNGSVDGTTMIGAAIGDMTNNCKVTFEGTNDFSGASINSKGLALKAGAVIGTVTSTTAAGNITFGGTINVVEGLPAYYVKSDKYDLNKAKITA